MIMMLKPIDGISESDGWNGARQMMANPAKFVDELKRFSNRIGSVTDKTINRIRNLSNKEQEGLARIKDVSSACEQIYNWLMSTLKLYDINKKVEPMKKRVAEMTKKLDQLAKDL